MSKTTLTAILTVPLLCLLGPAAAAAPLDVVVVRAPDVNCVFASDCTLAPSDFSATFGVPAASGDGRLQSRTYAPGEPGTQGSGLFPYVYRVDLTAVTGLTAVLCVDELRVPFGPVEPLDYNRDGDHDDVFVITAGGLGSVRPSSADLDSGLVTFRFQPPVCPGGRPGSGETSFFFGLASQDPPQEVTATVGFNAGDDVAVAARAPAASPPDRPRPGGCSVGVGPAGPIDVPIPGWTPACRCFEHPAARAFHCAFPHPDLVVVWRFPVPVPPGDPFAVEWTLVPLRDRREAAISVLAQGDFAAVGKAAGKLLLPGPRQGEPAVGEVWLVAPDEPGTHHLRARLTLPPRGRSGAVAALPEGRPGSTFTIEVEVPVGDQP